MYRPVHPPYSEPWQDNRWITGGRRAGEDVGHRRPAPKEAPFLRKKHGRWYEGNREVNKHKPQMYFVRPIDGKRRGTGGRLMDLLTGEGPDVFVIKCGEPRTLMLDRPRSDQWSGWDLTAEQIASRLIYNKDCRKSDFKPVKDQSAKNARSRSKIMKGKYNFQTRRYENEHELFWETPHHLVWSDARWPYNAKRRDMFPLSMRDKDHEWHSRVPDNAGDWPGGRPRSNNPHFR